MVDLSPCLELPDRVQAIELSLVIKPWARDTSPTCQDSNLHRSSSTHDLVMKSSSSSIHSNTTVKATKEHQLCQDLTVVTSRAMRIGEQPLDLK
jgi:hypothetical protein